MNFDVMATLVTIRHELQTSYTIRTFKSLHFVCFSGFLNEPLIFFVKDQPIYALLTMLKGLISIMTTLLCMQVFEVLY